MWQEIKVGKEPREFTFQNLKEDANYFFKVKARNAIGDSTWLYAPKTVVPKAQDSKNFAFINQ